MPVPEEIPTELRIAWEQAWSSCNLPTGEYIGSLTNGCKTYYFYKKGPDYFYETDYDRKMKTSKKVSRKIGRG